MLYVTVLYYYVCYTQLHPDVLVRPLSWPQTQTQQLNVKFMHRSILRLMCHFWAQNRDKSSPGGSAVKEQ